MSLKKLAGKLILTCLVSGCASGPPVIEPCTIINAQVAECTSTDISKPSYEKPVSKMRGWTAFGPEDIAAIRAYLKKSLQNTDSFYQANVAQFLKTTDELLGEEK
mgnify:CR=1 FL=1